ncbi:MAG: zinc ribbon domain-containing protein [Erysipelotrichaceae bacterium]
MGISDGFFMIGELLFFVVPIFIVVVFGIVILSAISPKFNGYLQSRQIKARKYASQMSKEDIKDIADINVDAKKESITKVASAIKEGFEEEKMFCKHCGEKIDTDSVYCNKCGGKQ